MASSTPIDAEEEQDPIAYGSGESLMARGENELHKHVALRVEAALGRSLPQVEVRFENVCISADIVMKDTTQTQIEIPTIANVIKMGVLQISSKKHVVKKQILRDVSGVFKPKTMTLILGQPGSGKSTLMKLLSGRFSARKSIVLEGEVVYNGIPRHTLLTRLPQIVSYVAQDDNHLPTLSVKETLEFAHACNGGGLLKRDEEHLRHGDMAENQAALNAAHDMYKHYPDIIIRQLGLEKCQSTAVGDAMLRGVSGGERKRVTTGEMAFGNKFVMMMDEISTGLDSASTFDIVSTQRSLAKTFGKTVVISLLQPSPEVFSLFDNVLLLNDGYVMYHGPCNEVLGYFEKLGFKCPPDRDVADFLMDLSTSKQRPYEVGAVPRMVVEFADAFKKSDIHKQYGMQMGEYMLSVYGVPTEKYWLWYGIGFLVASYVVFMMLSCLVLEYWRYESLENISFDVEDGDADKIVAPATDNYTPIKTPKVFPDPLNPKQTIDLLKGISGFALPGTITALMGSSGAGKTTLMD
ncbi:hypothetical protein BBO99_00003954, partial [Phytophthora kernoviae]